MLHQIASALTYVIRSTYIKPDGPTMAGEMSSHSTPYNAMNVTSTGESALASTRASSLRRLESYPLSAEMQPWNGEDQSLFASLQVNVVRVQLFI